MRPVILLLLVAVVCHAQETAEVLDNAAVIQMFQAGVAEDLIVESIASTPSTSFRLASTDLVRLKKAGVSDDVVRAMVARERGLHHPTTAPVPDQVRGSTQRPQSITSGQSVYVVAVEGTFGDLSLARPSLELERKVQEEFGSRKQFPLASSLQSADLVFFLMLDSESRLTEELALVLDARVYQDNRTDIHSLRSLALWQETSKTSVADGSKSMTVFYNSSVSKGLVKKFHKAHGR